MAIVWPARGDGALPGFTQGTLFQDTARRFLLLLELLPVPLLLAIECFEAEKEREEEEEADEDNDTEEVVVA